MELKVGHICGNCEKKLDEDDVSLMNEMRMLCTTCKQDICHNCALFCPTDDCLYWCDHCAKKCRICKRVGVECKDCFKQYKDEENMKRVKRQVCGFCYSKCEECGYGKKKKKTVGKLYHHCPKCNHIIRNE